MKETGKATWSASQIESKPAVLGELGEAQDRGRVGQRAVDADIKSEAADIGHASLHLRAMRDHVVPGILEEVPHGAWLAGSGWLPGGEAGAFGTRRRRSPSSSQKKALPG